MASPGTCPRGHELAENAVYCTVCWIRVEPIDPEVVAARRRRQRRIWIPLLGAGAVAFGVVVGGSLGLGSSGDPALVAGEAAPVPSAAAASTPAPSTEPALSEPTAEPVTVAAPLAATVAEPTVLTLEACVPDDTAAVLLKGRSSTDEPWLEVPAEITIGDRGSCADGELTVTVSSDTDAQRWRLVMRDGVGERVGKATVDAPVS